MTNLPLREKLKKLTDATKQQNAIPERSKSAGLIVFLILFGMTALILFALAVGLVLTGHTISALVTFIIGALLGYSVFKVLRADNIRQL